MVHCLLSCREHSESLCHSALCLAESVRNRRGRCRFISQLASNYSSFENGDFDPRFSAVLGIDADIAAKDTKAEVDVAAKATHAGAESRSLKTENNLGDDENEDDDDDNDDDSDTDGKAYFLMTKSTAPFCGRHIKVDVQISKSGSHK